MDFNTIIKKKRDGKELTEIEIRYFIKVLVNRDIDDSQIGAMLMAMYIRDLKNSETIILTKAMTQSGDVLSWNSEWSNCVVDKHSTGGVGDKVSIPLAPALAACGLKVPMLSGRALDFTGGTLDKLESIPGFNVNLTKEEMNKCLKSVGCFICSTTENICPADKILYDKRNLTSTIDNVNLIVGSIISKKAAEGVKNLILDIKVGKAAFMKDLKTAEVLARQLVNVSSHLGIKTKAFLTRMDYPLGRAVGNGLEIIESVKILKGEYIPQVTELVTVFGGTLLQMSGLVDTFENGRSQITSVLKNGEALRVFKQMLVNQNVTEETAAKLCSGNENETPIKLAKYQTVIPASTSGTVEHIDALSIGNLCYKLSTELNEGNAIDLSVGIEIKITVGETITENEPCLIVHHSKKTLSDSEMKVLAESVKISVNNNYTNEKEQSLILDSKQSF